jgi:hypothetical protein
LRNICFFRSGSRVLFFFFFFGVYVTLFYGHPFLHTCAYIYIILYIYICAFSFHFLFSTPYLLFFPSNTRGVPRTRIIFISMRGAYISSATAAAHMNLTWRIAPNFIPLEWMYDSIKKKKIRVGVLTTTSPQPLCDLYLCEPDIGNNNVITGTGYA